jgi:hypothetical protein
MLRVTAQTLFLFYLIVDVINNPVDLASGKLTRCSEIFPGLCLNHDNLAQNALTHTGTDSQSEIHFKLNLSCRSYNRIRLERDGGR